jgi:hypothetical protein
MLRYAQNVSVCAGDLHTGDVFLLLLLRRGPPGRGTPTSSKLGSSAGLRRSRSGFHFHQVAAPHEPVHALRRKSGCALSALLRAAARFVTTPARSGATGLLRSTISPCHHAYRERRARVTTRFRGTGTWLYFGRQFGLSVHPQPSFTTPFARQDLRATIPSSTSLAGSLPAIGRQTRSLMRLREERHRWRRSSTHSRL